MLHVWIKAYAMQALFDKEQLDRLQSLINSHLPNWSLGLSVGEGDKDPQATRVGNRSLHQTIQEFTRPQSGLARVMLSGRYEGLNFYAESSLSTFPLELNRLSIEIMDRMEIEGKDPVKWVWEFFESLSTLIHLRYGTAHSVEEFEAKNIDKAGGGRRALGVRLAKSLPGLYWLNYFGVPYVKIMGKDVLLTAPAYDVRQIGEGILLALDSHPSNWYLSTYRDLENEVLKHIGPEFFFSRIDPNRKTRAPDFKNAGRQ